MSDLKQSLMTTMFTADILFFCTLKAVKLRQRRALCSAPCMTENAIEENKHKETSPFDSKFY